MREIIGDPLTGQLPATQVLVSVRRGSRPVYVRQRSQWPVVPDAESVDYGRLRPGAIVAVRTRLGIRTWRVRTFGRGIGGRRYVVGMDRNGWCHSAHLSRIISVDTLQRHLAAGRAIDVRSTEVDVIRR